MKIKFGTTGNQSEEQSKIDKKGETLDFPFEVYDFRESELPREQLEQYNKKRKRKKIIVVTFLIVFVIFAVLGVYNSFFKPEKTPQQLTQEVNRVNKTTSFKSEGVLNFLKQNITQIIAESGIFPGQFSADPNSIDIIEVARLNDTNADVSFSAMVDVAGLGKGTYQFQVTVSFDPKTMTYGILDNARLKISEPVSEFKKDTHPGLSFEGLEKAPDDQQQSAKVFVTNLLTNAFNNKSDISQQFSGSNEYHIGVEGMTFVGITRLELYTSPNLSGYNCVVTYNLKQGETTFVNTSYLLLEPSGNSWVVKSVY